MLGTKFLKQYSQEVASEKKKSCATKWPLLETTLEICEPIAYFDLLQPSWRQDVESALRERQIELAEMRSKLLRKEPRRVVSVY